MAASPTGGKIPGQSHPLQFNGLAIFSPHLQNLTTLITPGALPRNTRRYTAFYHYIYTIETMAFFEYYSFMNIHEDFLQKS